MLLHIQNHITGTDITSYTIESYWEGCYFLSNNILLWRDWFTFYTQQWYMSYRFADSLRAGSGWNEFRPDPASKLSVPSWSCSQAVRKPVWHIPLLCVQWKTPDDGQMNCPKHVEFWRDKIFLLSSATFCINYKSYLLLFIYLTTCFDPTRGHLQVIIFILKAIYYCMQ